MNTLKVILAALCGVLLSLPAISETDERIWLRAKINGKPARLAFDSGSTHFVLLPEALTKFGLTRVPKSPDDDFPDYVAGHTEECMLTLAGTKAKTSFLVLNLPAYVGADFEGLIGWWPLRHNKIQIDAIGREISFLDELPSQRSLGTKVSLVADTGTLDLSVPRSARTNGVLRVDTGSDAGLSLTDDAWNAWRAAHPNNPITLQTSFSPDAGFRVLQESWADEITAGPLTFGNIPVSQSGRSGTNAWGDQYEGTIGLAALKCFKIFVDGDNNVAYFQPRKGRSPSYSHNRLGAVFVPTDGHTNQAVARVIRGGPAYEAGVRDGDILLQVDDVVVTSWSANWLDRFGMKAGTKLRLTLSRDGKNFSTTATLRQILEPSSTKKK